MKNDLKLIQEREKPKNEGFCPCDCTSELDKLTTGNPISNKEINKKNSCC